MKDGDVLLQALWCKALVARGLEAIVFWPIYDIEVDAWVGYDCLN